MIIQDNKVIVSSMWDSGVHLGFQAGIKNKTNGYIMKTLNEVLSRNQIESIEMVIATMISSYTEKPDV